MLVNKFKFYICAGACVDYKFSFCRHPPPGQGRQGPLSSYTSRYIFNRFSYQCWGQTINLSGFILDKNVCGSRGEESVCMGLNFILIFWLLFLLQLVSKVKPVSNFFCNAKIFTLFCQPCCWKQKSSSYSFKCVQYCLLII